MCEIVPNKGIGPVQFGMLRVDVHQAMLHEYGAPPNRGSSDKHTDMFFPYNSLRVSYRDDQVSFISVSPSMLVDFTFEGVKVFAVTQKALLRHIGKFDELDPDLSEENFSYFYPNLILVVSDPRIESEAQEGLTDNFAAVSIGDEGYLEAIRRIRRKDFFDMQWSDRTEPARSCRKVFESLRDLGADVALDKRGRVRRVKFMWMDVKRPVIDDDLKCLAELSSLEVVFLAGNREITDAGVRHLSGLSRLMALELCNTSTTDRALETLMRWPELRQIGLPDTLTANGLKRLTKATELEILYLELGEGAEAGLIHLRRLPSLRRLHCFGELTDAGLKHVEKLEQLEEFELTMTRVTKKGMQSLYKALPQLRK